MIASILGSALILLALLAVALQRLLSGIPAKELRRLAQRGDHLAQALYRPVAYAESLRLFLWTVAVLGLAGGSALLVRGTSPGIGFVVLAAALLLALVVLPSLQLTPRSAQAAAFVGPGLAFILRYLHGPLALLAGLIQRVRTLSTHSHMYEKQDLTALLHQQKEQPDNRIAAEDLELAHRALAFGDRQAGEIVQSRHYTLLVSADEAIGPILLDQLHKSGQSSFLVYKDSAENIVGSLLMRDAVAAKHGGRVLDLIRGDLCFVRDDFTLRQVLAAFQKTGHHTAVVINSFEELIGVLSLDRVLSELVGERTEDPTNYESRSAIANSKIAEPRPAREEPEAAAETEPEAVPAEATNERMASPSATEVVE